MPGPMRVQQKAFGSCTSVRLVAASDSPIRRRGTTCAIASDRSAAYVGCWRQGPAGRPTYVILVQVNSCRPESECQRDPRGSLSNRRAPFRRLQPGDAAGFGTTSSIVGVQPFRFGHATTPPTPSLAGRHSPGIPSDGVHLAVRRWRDHVSSEATCLTSRHAILGASPNEHYLLAPRLPRSQGQLVGIS